MRGRERLAKSGMVVGLGMVAAGRGIERERARRERETAEEEEEGGSGKVGGICSEFEMVEVKVRKDTCVVFVITVFATVKFCAPRLGEPRVFEFS